MSIKHLDIVRQLTTEDEIQSFAVNPQPFALDQIVLSSSLPLWARFPNIKHMIVKIIPSDTYRSLSFLRSFPGLRCLQLIRSNPSTQTQFPIDDEALPDDISLEGIECCQRLESLEMIHLRGLRDLDILAHCSMLTTLTIEANSSSEERAGLNLPALQDIPQFTKLRLILDRPRQFFMKSVFGGLTQLRHLEIEGAGKLLNLQFISGLSLETLIMTKTELMKTTGYDVRSLTAFSWTT